MCVFVHGLCVRVLVRTRLPLVGSTRVLARLVTTPLFRGRMAFGSTSVSGLARWIGLMRYWVASAWVRFTSWRRYRSRHSLFVPPYRSNLTCVETVLASRRTFEVMVPTAMPKAAARESTKRRELGLTLLAHLAALALLCCTRVLPSLFATMRSFAYLCITSRAAAMLGRPKARTMVMPDEQVTGARYGCWPWSTPGSIDDSRLLLTREWLRVPLRSGQQAWAP